MIEIASRWRRVVLIVGLAWSMPAVAQGPPGNGVRRVATANFTAEKITIDGVLDEPAWKSAASPGALLQKEPIESGEPSQPTDVLVLYDKDNLYISAYCHDSSSGEIIVNDISRDFDIADQDYFGILLDPFNDRSLGYYMSVTPVGGWRDTQILNEGLVNNANWDGVWYGEGKQQEDGYVVEMAIPFKTLRFSKAPSQVWGIQFFRRIRRVNEIDAWSPPPRRYTMTRGIAYMGELRGIQNVEPGRNFQIKPYVLAGANHLSSPVSDTEGDFKGGMDLKFGVTPGMILDLTVNTDFSHVEADTQQVNLTRFPLFFQEKREFFLENANVFELGPLERGDALPFHSRTIGLENGRPIPILAGGRLVGRAGDYQLGLLNMQTRSEGPFPATNFTAARLRRYFLANSNAGVLFLNRRSAMQDDSNQLVGLDNTLVLLQTDLRISSALAKTFTPSREGSDWVGKIEGEYQNRWMRVFSSYADIGENFNPRMGFVQRPNQGVRYISDEFELRHSFNPDERFGSFARELFVRFGGDQTLVWDRPPNGSDDARFLRTEDKSLSLPSITLEFMDATSLNVNYTRSFDRLVRAERIAGVLIPAGDYRTNRNSFSYFTNRSKPISANVGYNRGGYWTGKRTQYSFGVRVRPNYRLNANFTFSRNNINLASVTPFHTHEVGARVEYSFTPKMSFDAFVQYNNDADQITSNIRFRLIHRPLSDIYVVYNDRHDRNTEQRDWNMTVKYTHLLSF
jgi:hypothetical protein